MGKNRDYRRRLFVNIFTCIVLHSHLLKAWILYSVILASSANPFFLRCLDTTTTIPSDVWGLANTTFYSSRGPSNWSNYEVSDTRTTKAIFPSVLTVTLWVLIFSYLPFILLEKEIDFLIQNKSISTHKLLQCCFF